MKATQRIVTISLVLLTATVASGAATRVTMNTGTDYAPHWDPTPGAIRIAYLTSNDVGIVNSDGTGEDILIGAYSIAQTDDALAWVGSHLLFGDISGAHEVYDYNTLTSGVTKLFYFTGGTTHVGAIAARGQTVIWRVGWNTHTKSQLRVNTYNNLVANSTPTPPTAQNAGDLVLQKPTAGIPILEHGDGSIGVRGMSVLSAQEAIISLPIGSQGGWDLFRVDIDPSGGLTDPVQITTTGETDGKQNWFPEVSPSGSQILFARADYTVLQADRVYDIFMMNSNGSGLVNLTNTPGIQENSPTWSPNGLDYAFQRFDTDLPGAEADNWNIYVDQTPEPATMALLAIGGLAILRKRRRRS